MLTEYTPAGLHDFMQEEIAFLPRDTPILDVGSGSGAWLERLKALGFTDLTALDVKPPEIDVPFLRADLNLGELPTSRRFGLVTSFEVFEHIENSGAFLSIIERALELGGFALVTSPNVQALRYRIKWTIFGNLPSFDAKGEPGHITPLFLGPFRRLAATHNLVIDKAWTYPRNGTVMFRFPMQMLSAVARIFFRDPLPGDSIVLKLMRPFDSDRQRAQSRIEPPKKSRSRSLPRPMSQKRSC